MGKFMDLTGMKFNRLTVVRCCNRPTSDPEDMRREVRWQCVCDCGGVTEVTTGNIRSGGVKSCGCLRGDATRDAKVTHGLSDSTEMRIWGNLVQRVTNPRNPSYPRYGGRGIDLDPRWLRFDAFYSDMGPRPPGGLTLERVDNNKGYWPWNCIWADAITQGNNQRTNRILTLHGRSQSTSAWCRELNLAYGTVTCRVNRLGWSDERALTTPTKTPFKEKKDATHR